MNYDHHDLLHQFNKNELKDKTNTQNLYQKEKFNEQRLSYFVQFKRWIKMKEKLNIEENITTSQYNIMSNQDLNDTNVNYIEIEHGRKSLFWF